MLIYHVFMCWKKVESAWEREVHGGFVVRKSCLGPFLSISLCFLATVW